MKKLVILGIWFITYCYAGIPSVQVCNHWPETIGLSFTTSDRLTTIASQRCQTGVKQESSEHIYLYFKGALHALMRAKKERITSAQTDNATPDKPKRLIIRYTNREPAIWAWDDENNMFIQ